MNIVMTGATAGFGFTAAQQLLADGHTLHIGARAPEAAARRLGARAVALPLDLDRLASVRAFATEVCTDAPIDALVLNAGLQLSKPARSADGFERTFAVNHLAHFLLLNLLQPRLAPKARIVITSSGTHDPAEGTPVTPPVHAEADWLAFPERDPKPAKGERAAGFRAYSTSKLCNLMTVREMARRFPQYSVAAYDPAYVPGTGLGRDNPAPIAWLAGKIIPMLIKKDRVSTVPVSGKFLADLVTSPDYAQPSGAYWSVRGLKLQRAEPSVLARDSAAAAKLWDDSVRLAGL